MRVVPEAHTRITMPLLGVELPLGPPISRTILKHCLEKPEGPVDAHLPHTIEIPAYYEQSGIGDELNCQIDLCAAQFRLRSLSTAIVSARGDLVMGLQYLLSQTVNQQRGRR